MDIALFALLFGLFLGPIGLLIIFFPSIQPDYTEPDTGLPLELNLTAETTSRYSELDELKEIGAITQEEFDVKKREILGRCTMTDERCVA